MRVVRCSRGAALARQFVLAGSFLLMSFPLQAQVNKAWPRHDPQLIDKLYRGDLAHISDDNFGRMDLEAVVMAFRTDDKVKEKCDLFGGKGATAAQMVTFLRYVQFLNTDRDTGTFPSAQFLVLSVLSAATAVPG